jgi:signal peptidase I
LEDYENTPLEADEQTEEQTTPSQASKNKFKSIFEWLELFVIYFALGITLLTLGFRHCPVVGSSMYPTLKDGEMLIIRQFMYSAKAGDIIVCQSETYGLQTPLVKRVIATGGQTVSIDYKNWTVTVDGTVLSEDYVNRENKPMKPSDYLEDTFTVPEGKLFVMGDNRNGSSDSRVEIIGFIDERMVIGKVSLRLLPISEFEIF